MGGFEEVPHAYSELPSAHQAYSEFDRPEPLRRRVSGATLFHLGAIRRLNEFGIPPKITTISSVSGGSILNGFLASRLPAPVSQGIADFDRHASGPVRGFRSLDIRALARPRSNSAGDPQQHRAGEAV